MSQNGSSTMWLEHKQKVSIAELINGLVIQSGNDAAIVLAEHIAGTEESFVSLMNKHARNLGMNDTHFSNSHGLTAENHYTTARDLGTMASALIRDFPQYYHLYSERGYKFNNIWQPNRNNLLRRDRFVDGIKTGHTEAAGYCLVTSADRNNMRLITVVTGTRSERAREDETLKLLRYGYRFFTTHLIYESNSELRQQRIWYGEKEQLSVGVARPVYVTVPRGQYDNIKIALSVKDDLEAPLKQGQPVGEVTISLNDQLLRSEPVIALENIDEGNTWSQLGDWIIQLFD
jgi:D-alanyl-D-alanine carboxypeptidase (penicillin-binding protein 5/6)